MFVSRGRGGEAVRVRQRQSGDRPTVGVDIAPSPQSPSLYSSSSCIFLAAFVGDCDRVCLVEDCSGVFASVGCSGRRRLGSGGD
jgi:hypothetical protein